MADDLEQALEKLGRLGHLVGTDYHEALVLVDQMVRAQAVRIQALEEGLRPFANICLGRESFGDEAEIEIARPNVGEYAVGQNVSRARLLMKEFRQAARLLHDEGGS